MRRWDYKQENVLGNGNFSTVYRVTHRMSGKQYAIKKSRKSAVSVADKNMWLAVRAVPQSASSVCRRALCDHVCCTSSNLMLKGKTVQEKNPRSIKQPPHAHLQCKPTKVPFISLAPFVAACCFDIYVSCVTDHAGSTVASAPGPCMGLHIIG